MSPPAMTKQIDRLERDGLVERTQSVEDRRRVAIRLTEEGQRLLRRVRSRRTAWLAQRLGELDDRELAAIEAAIAPLGRLLREDEGR
jgi:DNA-binding MarR family transcriptional regulator